MIEGKTTSRDFFKLVLSEFCADVFGIFKIPKDDEQLKHYYSKHPVRDRFDSFTDFDRATAFDGKLLTVISTTFGKKLQSGLKFRAFLGLDVEFPVGKETIDFLTESLNYFNKSGYIFRTSKSYHLFVKDLFDNDLDLIREKMKYVMYSVQKFRHNKIEKYCKGYLGAKSFNDLLYISKLVLDEVKHIEDGCTMFYDLRHIARSIYSNERLKASMDHNVLLKEDGVRAQSFFCLNRRQEGGLTPYLEKIVG
jgi:hypothetical protein